MSDDSTHMRENELKMAQKMINAIQILLKKTEYNLSLSDNHRRTIEWELTEAELYEQAKKIVEPNKK